MRYCGTCSGRVMTGSTTISAWSRCGRRQREILAEETNASTGTRSRLIFRSVTGSPWVGDPRPPRASTGSKRRCVGRHDEITNARLQELRNAIREHPGTQAHTMWARLRRTHEVLAGNLRELDKLHPEGGARDARQATPLHLHQQDVRRGGRPTDTAEPGNRKVGPDTLTRRRPAPTDNNASPKRSAAASANPTTSPKSPKTRSPTGSTTTAGDHPACPEPPTAPNAASAAKTPREPISTASTGTPAAPAGSPAGSPAAASADAESFTTATSAPSSPATGHAAWTCSSAPSPPAHKQPLTPTPRPPPPMTPLNPESPTTRDQPRCNPTTSTLPPTPHPGRPGTRHPNEEDDRCSDANARHR